MILHHTGWYAHGRGDHWDWLLEPPTSSTNGLITFASPSDPRQISPHGSLWESLPRHREEYLTYEGPVSHDRGTVNRVARGLVDWIEFEPDTVGFELKEMEFLEPPSAGWPTGQYCLTRLIAKSEIDVPSTQWRLSRRKKSP